MAPVDGLGLEAGEPLGQDQLPGQVLGALGPLLRREALLEGGQLLRREEAALGEAFGEPLQTDRHAQPSPGRRPYYSRPWGERKRGSGVFFGQPDPHIENPSAEKDSRPLPRGQPRDCLVLLP